MKKRFAALNAYDLTKMTLDELINAIERLQTVYDSMVDKNNMKQNSTCVGQLSILQTRHTWLRFNEA
jgi:hypothetical protein